MAPEGFKPVLTFVFSTEKEAKKTPHQKVQEEEKKEERVIASIKVVAEETLVEEEAIR